MDTRMIDVAIGLSLVFALTSLLVAAMQEVYSSWRKLRGRVLHQAIVSFLGDDADFAKTLLAHPLLVSMAPEGKGQDDERRPSYLGADTLVAALVGTLLDDQPGGLRPDTPLQFVEAVKSKAAKAAAGSAPNADFVRGLASLTAGVEHDWAAFETRVGAWFDAVAERSGGWFKRKTQAGVFIIGLVVAAAVNINPIVVASRLWTDEPLRKAVVTAAERASATYSATGAAGATGGSQPPAPQASNAASATAAASGASQPASAVEPLASVEGAHTALMAALDRAALQARSVDTGRPLVQALALDGLRFERELLSWRAAGGAAGDAAAVRLGVIAQRMLATLGAAADPADLRTPVQRLSDTSAAAARATAPVLAPAPAVNARFAEAAASNPGGIPACGKGMPSDPALDRLCVQLDQLGALQQAGLPIGWSAWARPRVFNDGCAKGEARCQEAVPVTNLAWLGNLLLIPAGWLLTALACTLGAPFWFDALSKLVRLRGAGGKPPEPSTVGDKPQGSGMLVRSAAPAGSGTDASGLGAGRAAGASAPMSDALNDAERRLTVAEVQRVQRGLGLSEPEVSGFFDGITRRAIFAWQERQGLLPATGELSEAQLRELLAMRSGTAFSTPAAAAAASAAAATAAGVAADVNSTAADEHADGCDVPILEPTPDELLPAARGGVASEEGA